MSAVSVVAHPDSWVAFENLASVDRPYLPTYQWSGAFLNEQHRALAEAPREGKRIVLDIPGWLRVADALKLYELAYFCEGNVLELGTSRGLSSYVIASALRTAGRSNNLATVEIRADVSEVAKNNLAKCGLSDRVEFIVSAAADALENLVNSHALFDLCFVDHSHAYEAVADACKRMPDLIARNGFVVFHDYADGRNTRRKEVGESGSEYGVYAAVEVFLDSNVFHFYGVYGCCGVFRRK